jgi:hypothetical protein|eukprot:COSAG01_NODE_10660_length_2110_cov_3.362506_2_plen_83_part_00
MYVDGNATTKKEFAGRSSSALVARPLLSPSSMLADAALCCTGFSICNASFQAVAGLQPFAAAGVMSASTLWRLSAAAGGVTT